MRFRKMLGVLKKYAQGICVVLIATLVLVRLSLALYGIAAREEAMLLIDVLDVGQSEAILLRSGGETLLVDTGTASADVALMNELRRLGVGQINTLCVTHPHEDHYGNARALLSDLPIGSLLLPQAEAEDYGYALLLQTAASAGVQMLTAEVGMTLRLGECLVTVLTTGGEEENNACVVLRVTCGNTALLLMGDAEAATEERLLAGTDAALLDCDFLKVGHHGSDTGTTAAFLAAATPKIAAISCGAQNDYGFPHSAVLESLQAIGATVYRTDTQGTLHFASDGNSVFARKEN